MPGRTLGHRNLKATLRGEGRTWSDNPEPPYRRDSRPFGVSIDRIRRDGKEAAEKTAIAASKIVGKGLRKTK